MTTPTTERTRLVRVSADLFDLIQGRAENGDLVTYEWGEPDAGGIYEPTFTAHHDDNLVAARSDSLDVERLARAMTNVGRPRNDRHFKEDLAEIAAEYARLGEALP